MGFSTFHETAFYLCSASVVLEDILKDEKISELNPELVANIKELSESLNEYLDVAAITG